MGTPKTTSDLTEIVSPSDNFLVVDGLSFQAEWLHDPSETLACPSCDPNPLSLAFILSIWEAIVVLPLAQGTTLSPAYLPLFTQGAFQQGDMADRVLWKRITHMPIWGLNVFSPGVFPQLQFSNRDGQGAGPVRVKTRAKLDDKHALFYCINFVHDLFGLGNSGAGCNVQPDCLGAVQCSIPIQLDFWGKFFYHSRK